MLGNLGDSGVSLAARRSPWAVAYEEDVVVDHRPIVTRYRLADASDSGRPTRVGRRYRSRTRCVVDNI